MVAEAQAHLADPCSIPESTHQRLSVMGSRTLFLLGDVHGRFDHVLHEALSRLPAGVVFLGDIEPPRSMRELIAPLADEGIQVWWIRGNHDTESVTTWSHLVTALDENLDSRVTDLFGTRIAGFGGVFRSKVWSPGADTIDHSTACHFSFKEYASKQILATPSALRVRRAAGTMEQVLAALEDPSLHPKVLFKTEIRHLSSIFPADFLSMASLQTDVLVTHEAPSCHPYGHAGIDHLARSMGAKLVVHGHHHDSLDYTREYERMGFACVGVGFRGITELNLDTLETRCVRAGDYDVERVGRKRAAAMDDDDEY